MSAVLDIIVLGMSAVFIAWVVLEIQRWDE